MKLETLLTHPAVQALGRSLLHFLWQGSLLALLLWIVKTFAPASARVRYAVASLIMLTMPVALIVTVAQGYRNEPSAVSTAHRASSHPQQAPSETSREALIAGVPTSGTHAGVTEWLPGFVVCLWIAGVLLLSVRAGGGWMRAQRLTRRVLPASDELEDMMTRLKHRLGVSGPVRLYTSAIAAVPTVIGWLRPVILLPVATIIGLSESQLRAILAHELAHIRRHDYLVNLLQTAIETVLFYHPAVWWVGKQMRIEREHCCDDIAVAVSGNAFEYAEALAELEQIRAGIPEPALAATGGELIGRIRRLLGQSPSEDATSRSLGTIATVAALALFVAGTPLLVPMHAAPQQAKAFDVASVKANVSSSPNSNIRPSPGRVIVSNMPVKTLIAWAYNVRYFQISGGPGWIDSTRYDIEGKVEGKPNQDQMQLMMQTLLGERFKLALHRSTKELPIYKLTVAKDGFKLRPLKEGDCIVFDPNHPPSTPGLTSSDFCGNLTTGRGSFEGTSASMTDLALSFSSLMGRTVVDRTGITGVFHVRLKFAPDDPAAGISRPSTERDNTAPPADNLPSIFTALQEQLGLKLESGKGPVDVLVIDHVERPSEN
jgi:uncharacterized protein (TIGR03435 family)